LRVDGQGVRTAYRLLDGAGVGVRRGVGDGEVADDGDGAGDALGAGEDDAFAGDDDAVGGVDTAGPREEPGAGGIVGTAATWPGDVVSIARSKPPRIARNPNDAATAARNTSAATMTAVETGSRVGAAGGAAASWTPWR
jgi:hypothetical protein